MKQVAHGVDPLGSEDFRQARTDTFHVLYGGGQFWHPTISKEWYQAACNKRF
jgi:hypothetical protein